MWEIIAINMVLFMGIMSRMVPATTLNTAIPEMRDRGAYMSITSSMQQIAGGIGAVVTGWVVHQQTKTSPLENYDIVGYIYTVITIYSIVLVYRVHRMVKKKRISVPIPETI
jgi:predicted MFS family arabinose efflux permease